MIVEYIHHSGYVVETSHAIYVFDYVKGRLPAHYLSADKPCYLLVTHVHPDHYSPAIYSYKKTLILSYDIPVEPLNNVFKVQVGDELRLGVAKIHVFGSTDAGVSYLIDEPDGIIFHGGDLNNWHWKDESTTDEVREAQTAYLEIIEPLTGRQIDVCMFAVDPRMGSDYDLGARQLADRVHIKHFFPMHFGADATVLDPLGDWLTIHHPQTVYHKPVHDNQAFRL